MQVTVRRTGLLAVSRLLRELPEQIAVTELWVRAALPMVSTFICQHCGRAQYSTVVRCTRLQHSVSIMTYAETASHVSRCTASRSGLYLV